MFSLLISAFKACEKWDDVERKMTFTPVGLASLRAMPKHFVRYRRCEISQTWKSLQQSFFRLPFVPSPKLSP